MKNIVSFKLRVVERLNLEISLCWVSTPSIMSRLTSLTLRESNTNTPKPFRY